MSQISRTYNFTDGTTAFGSEVESEINNIVDVFNAHDIGTSSWTVLKTAANITITGAGKGLVVASPDGAHTYLISVDNDGSIVTEQLS